MQSILLFAAFLVVICLGFSPNLQAQASNATCQNASAIGAANPSYPLPVNQPSAPQGNNYDCLGTQPNPLWFRFQLNTAGSLELELRNSNNVDVDFVLYGPFVDAAAAIAACGNLGNGGVGGTIVDCSFLTNATEYVNITNGNAGEVYMLLVTNFSNQPTAGNTQIVLGNSTATMVNPYVGAPVVVGTCANLSNGSISTTVTNGTAPYAYLWSNGATTANITGLAAGSYGFTVTDATGATFANSSIFVSATLAITNNNISVCNGDSALIFGVWRAAAGLYVDTIFGTGGNCDSVFRTNLLLISPVGSVNLDLCVGDSVFVGGSWQDSSGYYSDTLVSAQGCDSILYTYVNFYTCSPVWAGDADDNLIVDGDDWLQLGFANNISGYARTNASINWIAQPAIDWGFNTNNVETKHADCNGDGQIDDNDTLAVVQNYSLTHVRNGASSVVNNSATVQLIPQQNTYNVGDLVKIDVVIGQNGTPVPNAYGYFFKIDAGNIFRAGTLQFTPTASFLGTNADVWTLSKELTAAQQIDISQVRHNQAGMNGFGKVGEISFVLSNNAGNSSPVLGFVNTKIVNSQNQLLPATYSAATFNVNPTSIQENTAASFAAKIVPNPVQNQAYLEFELGENSAKTQIRIINALGQVQYQQVLTRLNAGTHRIDLQTNLAAGTYFIEISNQNQTARVPFVKIQ